MPTQALTDSEVWGGVTQYVVNTDNTTIDSADAFRVDQSTLEAERVKLAEDDKVELESEDIPDDFEFVSVAEDHSDTPNVWGIWATEDGDEWTAVQLSGGVGQIDFDYPDDETTDDPNA